MSGEEGKNIVEEDSSSKSTDVPSEAEEKLEGKKKEEIVDALKKRQASIHSPNIHSPLDDFAVNSAMKMDSFVNRSGILGKVAQVSKFHNNSTLTNVAKGINQYSGMFKNFRTDLFPKNVLNSVMENYNGNSARIASVVSEAPKIMSIEPLVRDNLLSDTMMKMGEYEKTERTRKKKIEEDKVNALNDICQKNDELIKQTAKNQNLTTELIISSQETNKNTQDMVKETRKSSNDNKKFVIINICVTIFAIIVTIVIAYFQSNNDAKISRLEEEIENLRVKEIIDIGKSIDNFEKYLSNQQSDNSDTNLMILEELKKLNTNLLKQNMLKDKIIKSVATK